MLEVIGAGLPRTGTLSLKTALERLGYGPCYHMHEIIQHLGLIDRWLPTPPGDRAGWERVFAGYRSTTDWPASFFWRELAAAFPEAKVVLTVRDPAAWYASFRALISLRTEAATADDLSPHDRAFEADFARLVPLFMRMAHETFDGVKQTANWTPDEPDAVRGFERHAAAVRDSLPAGRLLVFDVRAGWGPLCDFLGVAPPDEPFPRLNDIEDFRRRLEGRSGAAP